MSAQIAVSITLAEINCGLCGATYAINERYRQQCYDHGRSWNCPYCKANWGYQGSEIDRLKKQLQEKTELQERTLSRLNESEREREKANKRTKAGVCPCCNRTFKQLARHMETKHKDFKP